MLRVAGDLDGAADRSSPTDAGAGGLVTADRCRVRRIRAEPRGVEIVLAIVSAALFALGSVLQQRAGDDTATIGTTSGALLLRMARRPVWLAGIAADGLGFVAQAIALGIGQLAIVQPLLVTSVAFALPLGAWINHQRVGRRETIAALVVVGGLAAFVVIANPAGGRDNAPVHEWLIAGAACAAACAPLVLLAPRRPGARRAALLGAAAGILFALSAALTKTAASELSGGVVALATSWPPYALAFVGYVSMTINQLSLDAKALPATMATSTALDPIAGVALGLTLFAESIHAGPVQLVAIVLALTLALGAMVVLARDQSRPPAAA